MPMFDLKNFSNRLFPAPDNIYLSFNHFWLFVGCLSLYGFIALKLPAIHVARIFLGLMLIAFFVSAAKAPQAAKRDPVWSFVIAAILISIFTYAWSNLAFPAYAEPYPSTDNLLNLCLFFPVAWWIGGQNRNVMWLYAVALVGFIGEIIINGSWAELISGLSGKRVNFGIRNAQHTAIFFSVALLGWLLMIRRIVGAGRVRTVLPRFLMWAGVTVFLGTGWIITQTRAAWLGLIAALVVVGLTILIRWKYPLTRKLGALFAVILVAGTVFYPQIDTIKKRVTTESDVIHQLVSGNVDKLPYSSIGIRIHIWLEAWEWIKQRPITGWGYEARSKVIDESKILPEWVIDQFGHFHNSYLEILLSYGLLGMGLIAGLFGFVALESWRAWRNGLMPADVFLFGVGFSVFWVIVNLFESYFLWSTGVYLMALIGGSLYTFPLSLRLRNGVK